jgi:hypothetical protein
MNNNSPLESLAAFAITFVVGALCATAVNTYAKWIQRKAQSTEGI